MSIYPISYWFVIGVIIVGGIWSFRRIKDGTGVPMLAVLGTVTVWYVGDAYYNDYAHSYALIFTPDVLDNAWWQVAWFLIVFLVTAPLLHRWFNRRYLGCQSGTLQLARFGINHPPLQRQLDILFRVCLIIYAIIVLVAAIRLQSQIPYFFFPFLGYKAEPWGRARIGSGFDALLSFTMYIQLMVTTIFGVLAAISTNPRTRFTSLILCFITWPYFLFDRTRNTILAVVIPPIVSWVFLRLRGGILKKIIALAGCYILVSGWMAFIIQNRSEQTITEAFQEKGFNLEKESKVHQQGLNMFEELCWVNTFIEKGTYKPNWGARYFAELVNPIPRVLWPGKPLIGIDYAIARGQGQRAGAVSAGKQQAAVYATVSTGMIGQGEVNFGRFFGPMAAALLMSFWVAILARQDLHIMKLGRLPLYALGLILTFNLGRDITLITLYPFVFLAVFVWWYDRYLGQSHHHEAGSNLSGLPSDNVAPIHNLNRGQPLTRSVGKTGKILVRPRKVVTRFGPGPNPYRRSQR